MANGNRSRKRNRNRPGQPKDSGPQAARRFIDVPPPIAVTDFSKVRICPGPDRPGAAAPGHRRKRQDRQPARVPRQLGQARPQIKVTLSSGNDGCD